MSPIRNGYAVSSRRGFLSSWFAALLALALFDAGAAIAQEGKQIKLTEKHIQSFMGAYNDMVKVYESADPDKPGWRRAVLSAHLARSRSPAAR